MSLSGYAEPRNAAGVERPNKHYNLCGCGKWKKKEARTCFSCRSGQYDDCACGRRKKVTSVLCRTCHRGGLCARRLHTLTPENRRSNGACKICWTAKQKLPKPPPQPPVCDFLVGYVERVEPLLHWKWYGFPCTD